MNKDCPNRRVACESMGVCHPSESPDLVSSSERGAACIRSTGSFKGSIFRKSLATGARAQSRKYDEWQATLGASGGISTARAELIHTGRSRNRRDRHRRAGRISIDQLLSFALRSLTVLYCGGHSADQTVATLTVCSSNCIAQTILVLIVPYSSANSRCFFAKLWVTRNYGSFEVYP